MSALLNLRDFMILIAITDLKVFFFSNISICSISLKVETIAFLHCEINIHIYKLFEDNSAHHIICGISESRM